MNDNIIDEIKYKYRTGGIVTQLIMINIGVFLLINIVKIGFVLMTSGDGLAENGMRYERLLHYIMVPDSPKVWIKQFWSIFTYMFAHERFLHILFNMLWLYWFGIIFRNYIGESKILPVYIMGGIAGAVLYMIAFNVFPYFNGVEGYAIGASASVMAIVVGVATMMPNHEMRFIFIGSVKLKWIAAFVVVLDFISITNSNAGGHIAHLGGALFGYLFIAQYKNGNDWSKPFYNFIDGTKKLFDFSSSKPKRKGRASKVKMAFKNEEKIKFDRKKGSNSTISSKAKQEKIDEILDKIGKSGYPSLSKEEKAFLFQYSRE